LKWFLLKKDTSINILYLSISYGQRRVMTEFTGKVR